MLEKSYLFQTVYHNAHLIDDSECHYMYFIQLYVYLVKLYVQYYSLRILTRNIFASGMYAILLSMSRSVNNCSLLF